MGKWLLRFLKLAGVLLLLYLAWHWDSLYYGVRQGYGQVKVLIYAKPIGTFLQNPEYPDSLKQRIRLIQDVRQYAIDSLGMDGSHSYEKLYDQGGKPLIWLVTASEPYGLQAYEWDFPVAGKFSYKGFFSKKEALTEGDRLKEKGLDVNIGEISAWSTLGWLNDPILSNMLGREEGRLAELIIHELMHGTLYVRDGVTFNENLASFIGEQGAERYLRQKFGGTSAQYAEYLAQRQDSEVFTAYVLDGTERLDSLYAAIALRSDTLGAYGEKYALIGEIVEGTKALPIASQRFRRSIAKVRRLPNNAYFMHFRRYDAHKYLFEEELRTDHANNLKAYIDFLREKYR